MSCLWLGRIYCQDSRGDQMSKQLSFAMQAYLNLTEWLILNHNDVFYEYVKQKFEGKE